MARGRIPDPQSAHAVVKKSERVLLMDAFPSSRSVAPGARSVASRAREPVEYFTEAASQPPAAAPGRPKTRARGPGGPTS